MARISLGVELFLGHVSEFEVFKVVVGQVVVNEELAELPGVDWGRQVEVGSECSIYPCGY